MRIFVLAALCVSLGACGAGRLLSYGGQTSDATVNLGPATFRTYVHPADDTLLIQRAVMQSGATDGSNLIAIVADQFLSPVECTSGSPVMIASGSWEVSFSCPQGVNLRELVGEQRDALKAGAPIQPRIP